MNIIVEIALDKIEIGERLRGVDPAWVEFLAASIAESGQHTPVKARKIGRGEKYALIAGGHRMAAMKLSRVVIECLPWQEVIRRYDRPETLFYLDPPYWGCENDYAAAFDRS